MRRYQFIDYAPEVNCRDLDFMHPNLLLLLAFVNQFCLENDLKFKVTSIYRDEQKDKELKASSRTHREGRAVDFSIRGWEYHKVQLLVDQLNKLVESERLENGMLNPFYEMGALSATDHKQRVIVVHKNHDGEGNHAHLQVRPTDEWLEKTYRGKL